MLYATGTENSGVSVFVQDERLVFDYNAFGDHHVVESDRDVPVGASVVGRAVPRGDRREDRRRDARDRRRRRAAALDVPFVMRIISSIGPSVGHDHGSPVSDRYTDAFPFAGTLRQVDIQLLTQEQAEAAAAASDERAAMGRQ